MPRPEDEGRLTSGTSGRALEASALDVTCPRSSGGDRAGEGQGDGCEDKGPASACVLFLRSCHICDSLKLAGARGEQGTNVTETQRKFCHGKKNNNNDSLSHQALLWDSNRSRCSLSVRLLKKRKRKK